MKRLAQQQVGAVCDEVEGLVEVGSLCRESSLAGCRAVSFQGFREVCRRLSRILFRVMS
ncbi:hypothetical protein [Desulfuromonas versatilis]|uniref:hypothetical protein n=1 Tax=Desulfuromonas versatilis TaxID=2802975 RepID=UPI001C8449B3|nr:hypothetical protein [Desulfuromonas versatilis]